MKSRLLRALAAGLVIIGGCSSSGGNASPILSVLAPSSPLLSAPGSMVQIDYTDADADDIALTSLYADRDGDLATTNDQIAIALNRPEGDGSIQTVMWDTSGVASGVYAILAVTTDGSNPPVNASAAGGVTINAPPSVSVAGPASDLDVRVGSLVRVDYVDNDLDDSAATDFFADGDGDLSTTGDQYVIATARPEQNGTPQNVDWDTAAVASGSYFVLAVTSDGVNAPVVSTGPGVVTIYDPGNAIELLGDGGNVEFTEALIGDRTVFTIEFWIKPRWPPTAAPHPFRNAIYAESYNLGGQFNGAVRHFVQIVNEDDGTAPGYRLGSITLEEWPATSGHAVFSEPLPESEWRHVAFVRDGATLRIYVDGKLDAEGVAQQYTGPDPVLFHLGMRVNPVSGDNYGWAILDDVRVSSVARYSADFVSPKIAQQDADTLSLWRFDETSGTTTSDATGNHTDGVLSPTAGRAPADR